MEVDLEVLQLGGRGRQYRKWPTELKARIVAETLMPGASVGAVAERHGIPPNHVSTWRSLARNGRLVLPAPEHPSEFASVMVDSRSPIVGPSASGPEILVGGVVIRLETAASAERIAAVVRALSKD